MLNPALLEATFAGAERKRFAEQLLGRVRSSVHGETRHYTVVMGPRGIGKTHLAALVCHRVASDPSLNSKLRISWLPDDAERISCYAEFLEAILIRLDEWYDTESYRNSKAFIEAPSVRDLENVMEDLVLRYLDGRVLLLVVENLDTILRTIGDDGQKRLRALLQNYGVATIIGTASTLLSDLTDRDQPFFGFFQQEILKPLSDQDCVELLVQTARFSGDYELVEFFKTSSGIAKVKESYHLAGGLPRLYVMLYQLLKSDPDGDLTTPFANLVQELTPYYESRVQTLTDSRRSVLETLSQRQSPMAGRDFPNSTASNSSLVDDLRALRELGYVGVNDAFFALREPLMRLCLAAKREHDPATALVTDLLRIWYRPTSSDGSQAPWRKKVFDFAAFADRLRESQRRDERERRASLDQLAQYRETAGDDLALSAANRHLTTWPKDDIAWNQMFDISRRRGELHQLAALLRNHLDLYADYADGWYSLGACYSHIGEYDAAVHASGQAVKLAPGNTDYLSNHLFILKWSGSNEELRAFADQILMSVTVGPETTADQWLLLGAAHDALSADELAVHAFIQAIRARRKDYDTWQELSGFLINAGRERLALTLTTVALARFSEDPRAWYTYGRILVSLGRSQESLTAAETASSLAPTDLGYQVAQLQPLLNLGRKDDIHRLLTRIRVNSLSLPNIWGALPHAELFVDNLQIARETLTYLLTKKNHLRSMNTILGPTRVVDRTDNPVEWQSTIDLWVTVHIEHSKIPELGKTLVLQFFDRPHRWSTSGTARLWVEAWGAVAVTVPELQPWVNILQGAEQYLYTGDSLSLIALAADSGCQLTEVLSRYERKAGLQPDKIDEAVTSMLTDITNEEEAESAKRTEVDLLRSTEFGRLLQSLPPEASANVALPAFSDTAKFLTFVPLPERWERWAHARTGMEVLGAPTAQARIRFRISPLLFYEDVHLLVAEDTSRRGCREMFALCRLGGDLFGMDWTNAPIYTTNERWGIQLDHPDKILQYCRFFFHFVYGRHGFFHIVDDASELPWKGKSDQHVSQARDAIKPLAVVDSNPESHQIDATILFRDGLFGASISLENSQSSNPGMVSMSNERLYVEGLPVHVSGSPFLHDVRGE